MKCKNCSALRWHPNKGLYCTVPHCEPYNTLEDIKDILNFIYGGKKDASSIRK